MTNRSSSEYPVFFYVHRLSRSLMRGSMAYYLHEFGLGVPQVQILNTLGRRGPLVSKDIAEGIAMNKALVSRSLGELMELGFIEGANDANDARRRLWTLTQKGRKFVEKYEPIGLVRRRGLLKVLSAEDQSLFVDILDKLYRQSEKLRAEEKTGFKKRRRSRTSAGDAKSKGIKSRQDDEEEDAVEA